MVEDALQPEDPAQHRAEKVGNQGGREKHNGAFNCFSLEIAFVNDAAVESERNN